MAPYTELGTELRGRTLDADTLLSSLRYARENGGTPTASVAPELQEDFPEAGQFLVHFDQHFGEDLSSGEVCMALGKARQYVTDYSTLAEGSATEAWRLAAGVRDAGVRRVAAGTDAYYTAYGYGERQRAHLAQIVYGTPYVVEAPAVGRVP